MTLVAVPYDQPRPRVALLACGVASSLVYVFTNVIGSMRWDAYSSASQTVSELYAIGAPSRATVLPLGILYDALLVAFGVGVWRSAGSVRRLRVTAALLMIIGAIGLFWPPMHMRGAVTTLTDTMHIVFAVVVVVCTLLGVGFAASVLGRRFRLYSIATLVTLLVFGGLAALDGPKIAQDLPTPWIGVNERINIGAYLLWVNVLAIALVRTGVTSRERQRARARARAIPSGAAREFRAENPTSHGLRSSAKICATDARRWSSRARTSPSFLHALSPAKASSAKTVASCRRLVTSSARSPGIALIEWPCLPLYPSLRRHGLAHRPQHVDVADDADDEAIGVDDRNGADLVIEHEIDDLGGISLLFDGDDVAAHDRRDGGVERSTYLAHQRASDELRHHERA
jgi:hypothetical protein